MEVAPYGTGARLQGLALTASFDLRAAGATKPKQRQINDQGGGVERSLRGEWEWAARKARKTMRGRG
jgi:hypothetical protein